MRHKPTKRSSYYDDIPGELYEDMHGLDDSYELDDSYDEYERELKRMNTRKDLLRMYLRSAREHGAIKQASEKMSTEDKLYFVKKAAVRRAVYRLIELQSGITKQAFVGAAARGISRMGHPLMGVAAGAAGAAAVGTGVAGDLASRYGTNLREGWDMTGGAALRNVGRGIGNMWGGAMQGVHNFAGRQLGHAPVTKPTPPKPSAPNPYALNNQQRSANANSGLGNAWRFTRGVFGGHDRLPAMHQQHGYETPATQMFNSQQ